MGNRQLSLPTGVSVIFDQANLSCGSSFSLKIITRCEKLFLVIGPGGDALPGGGRYYLPVKLPL